MRVDTGRRQRSGGTADGRDRGLDGRRACGRCAMGSNRGALNLIWWGQGDPDNTGSSGLWSVRRKCWDTRVRADRTALCAVLNQVLQPMGFQEDLIEERQDQCERPPQCLLPGQSRIHAVAATSTELAGACSSQAFPARRRSTMCTQECQACAGRSTKSRSGARSA
jgi:hypothetical protein